MQTYQRYPLVMHHPGAMPAVLSDARNESGLRPAQSARFQPVTVNNEDQEAQHRAQGYLPINEPNEAAFVRVQAAPMPFGHSVEEWPKMVNGRLVEDPNNPRQVGPIEYPKWVAGRIVQNRDEELELLGPQPEPEALTESLASIEDAAETHEQMAIFAEDLAAIEREKSDA